MRFSPSSGRSPSIRSRRLRFRRYRPSPLDRLESRQLLAIQPVTEIVVGRTLTAYSEGAVTNGELRITYSVYNQTESELTNVQLSSTLASGVTFLDATAEPVRAGQALTWNLGGLSAFGRASIEVRVGLDPASSQAIDTGSAVSALLNGLGVTDTAPAARLRSGQIAPELLAATPDADSDDPFIQEQAARLDYDASHIFEFLRDGIGYDSYVGSLRGSRGALWSAAGNTLDEASLGVALYRASGIPAQYARGSLPDPLAHELILSMFPEPLRILGFVPDNAEKGDPANDPRLLAEARDHYWIQFDTGVGMTDADTTFAGSMIGQSFAAGVTTFTEVADNLRHKVRVQLDRELANTASALFGVGVLGVSTVLEATFNAAALVGRPLSIGHFVNRQGLGSPIFSSITNTYTPFIAEYDLAADNTNAHVISGATFEELLTNFPFGSQILTGLFLTVELSGPDGPPERYERTLVDLIGFDIRTNGGTPSLDFDPMALPTLTPFDVFTLNVQSSKIDDAAVGRYAVLVSELQELVADRVGDDPVALVSESATLAQQLLMATTHVSAAEFFLFSDLFADQLAQAGVVRAYPDRPRLVITSNQTASSGIAATQVGFQSAIDLRRDALRVVVPPGQNTTAVMAFQIARGFSENVLETSVVAMHVEDAPDAAPVLSTIRVFRAAQAQEIGLRAIGEENLLELDVALYSAEAKARITATVNRGKLVLVPERSVEIDGAFHIAWYEIDPATGETIGVTEDGGHQAIAEYAAAFAFGAAGFGVVFGMLSYINDLSNCFPKHSLADCKGMIQGDLGNNLLASGLLDLAGGPISAYSPIAQGVGIFQLVAGLFQALSVVAAQLLFDPPLPDQFISPPPLDDLSDLVGSGVVTRTAIDPLFTLPFGGVQLPTVFRIGIRNGQSNDDRFLVQVTNPPVGFEALISVADIGIPAGQLAEVGLALRPTGALPLPGTVVSFDVTATSVSNPSVTHSFTTSFTVPEIRAVTAELESTSVTTLPGLPTQVNLTLGNVGNIETNVLFDFTLSAGLSLSGLSPVMLEPGEFTVQTLTITPAAGVPLNQALTAQLEIDHDGIEPLTLVIPVRTVVPGVAAIAEASGAAAELGNPDLAGRLNDLSIVLTSLVQFPGDPVVRAQALASLDSIVSLLAVDPILVTFVGPLSEARDELAGANGAAEVQQAVIRLGAELDEFGTAIENLNRFDFTLALINNTQVAQPTVPREFNLVIQNVGADTATYAFAVTGLPMGVLSQFSSQEVTLAPGQAAGVTLTLTETAIDELRTFAFEVVASVVGVTPVLSKSATGTLTSRQEFISIARVTASPPFSDPGGSVAITARLLNAVNRRQEALATYRVLDSTGLSVFTSSPVEVELNLVASIVDLDLGSLDTTGFANGNYTIEVSLRDDLGNPIPGGVGTAALLIGSPVSATQSVADELLLPGTNTVTTTIDIASLAPLDSPLSPIGLAAAPGATTAVRNGDFIYTASPAGIGVFDIAGPNLNQPQLVRTVGFSAFTMEIRGDLLIAVRNGAFATRLDTYSLADPSNPLHLGTTGEIPYGSAASVVVTETQAFVVIVNLVFFTGSNDVNNQNGAVLAINIENPAAPFLDGDALSAAGTPAGRDGVNDGVLFNTNGTSTDGVTIVGGIDVSGGDQMTWDSALVAPGLLLVTGSTATGGNTQAGVGILRVVDVSDPRNMRLLRDIPIPGTVHAFGLAVEGTRALVTATEGGISDFTPGHPFTGNLVLATFDLADPANPQLIRSERTDDVARRITFDTSLGNGLFAFGSAGSDGDSPRLNLVSASDPSNLVTVGLDVPAVPNAFTGGPDLIITIDGSSLILYQVLAAPGIPITVRVEVPHNTGVSIVPNSFNIAPDQVVPGADFDTLVFNLPLTADQTDRSITWQSAITELRPGEARNVTLGTTVDFVSQATDGRITLPAMRVAAAQILGLTPAQQSARPGEDAEFLVSITNPTDAPRTFDLTVEGIASHWVSMAGQATVPAQSTIQVPLTLTSDAFAALSTYGFVVTASDGFAGSVQGSLALSGEPLLPDVQPESHGAHLGLAPLVVEAGQGGRAVYTLRLTNTGSVVERYRIRLSGLPAGVTADVDGFELLVPPGASNSHELTIVLSLPQSVIPQTYPVTFIAESLESPAIATVDGQLVVSNLGVRVAITPSDTDPGGTFTLGVTNTGTSTQTFRLSLAGPAALVAALGQSQVTIGPGATLLVPITTTSVDFALPGSLPLTAMAEAVSDSDIRSAATATLSIAASQGVLATANPVQINVPEVPGTGTYQILVENLGNLTDTFRATISSTQGPVSATFIGFDGQPTQTIESFMLPGLSTGALTLQVQLTGPGDGVVQVLIRSIQNENVAAATAVHITHVQTPIPTTTQLRVTPASPIAGQPVVLAATITPATLGTLVGSVVFSVDGVEVTPILVHLVDGQFLASTTIPGLSAGSHLITAEYSGDGTHSGGGAFTTITVQPATQLAPQVTQIQRFGVHARPTAIVVTFEQALDPATANRAASYTLQGPGGRILIRSAIYDPLTQSVVLKLARKLPLAQTFHLTISGAGAAALRGASGAIFDGDGDGTPGGNHHARITRQSWVPTFPVEQFPRNSLVARMLLGSSVPAGPLARATKATRLARPRA